MYEKVVVTGGRGFLGGALCRRLEQTGHEVVSFHSSQYDLRDRRQIDDLLLEHRPDAVIHLAAVVGGIGANQAEPGRFFYENAKMGIELIEACRVAGTPKVVVSGTVCAYPKFAPLPFSEAELWNGYPEETNAPYGLAKKMLLTQAQAYRAQYGMNCIYLLPVNLYGPGDNFDLESGHVIPAMVRKFIEARDTGRDRVTLWGDGSPTREFLYVEDAARGFELALEGYDEGDPVNLGSGEEISIMDLAEEVRRATRFEGTIHWDTSRPNGQPRRKLSTDRARDRFGFESTVSFAVGLASTVDWYETVGQCESARA